MDTDSNTATKNTSIFPYVQNTNLVDIKACSKNTDIVMNPSSSYSSDDLVQNNSSRRIKRRVIASLTTMPDRYHKIIKTLRSLNNQTYQLDAIYLSLPERSKRLDIPYPPVTAEISELCTVVRCPDYGPITKILGGLLQESDPNTIIITFDDDMIYPPDLVSALINYHEQYPESAIGSSGMLLRYNCPMCAITPNEDNFIYRIPKFSVPPQGRKVDSIYGYSGALYLRKFFPPNDLFLNTEIQNKFASAVNLVTLTRSKLEQNFLDYALVDDNMFMNDDITISGYLSLHNIDRRIFPNIPVVSFVLSEDTKTRIRNDNEISYNLDRFFQRMNAAIIKCKSLGMYSITEPVDISESIAGVAAVIIICVLILIVLIVYILWSPNEYLSSYLSI